MHPSNSLVSVDFIASGATQLLVGPASCLWMLQMKVRSSTRATSLGSDSARKLPGRLVGSGLERAARDQRLAERVIFGCEPSHQWMRSGRVSAATCPTQC